MLIDYLVQQIRLIFQNTRSGYLKDSQVTQALTAGVYDFYQSQIEYYRKHKVEPKRIQQFKKIVTGQALTAGVLAKPSDFVDGIAFINSANGKEGAFVDAREWWDRKSSAIVPSSTTDPIAEVRGSSIYFDPVSIVSVDMIYYRRPNIPPFVYATTTDGDGRGTTFNAGASTDLEFGVDCVNDILRAALAYLGISLQDVASTQLGAGELQAMKSIQLPR
jgi:hypothetical protein